MKLATIILVYVTRVFLAAVMAMLAGLTVVLVLFDTLELLRRSVGRPDATLGIVTEIAIMRVPWMAMEVLPFAILLGGIVAFWRLARSHELVVVRSAGVSAWQFLAGPVLCAALLGAFATAVISPVSATMRARADALDAAYLRNDSSGLALAGEQLWVRQADHGLVPDGIAILHASGVALVHGRLTATHMTVFRLDDRNGLLTRIEAGHAELEAGAWQLQAARVLTVGNPPTPPTEIELPTDMTVNRVQESVASPDTFGVWALPGFIRLLQRSGFSTVRHRLHFQSLLALPLLAGTMALLAAGFSMRPQRRGGVARMLGSGVVAGFALFVVAKFAEQIGDAGTLPVVLAAWAPAASGLLLATALLLHLEDG
jgi:lipopolysaccharide export system permease protein